MEKVIKMIVNLLPNIIRKIVPEGALTKVGAVGAILMGLGAVVVEVMGGESGIGLEPGVAMILAGLSVLGLYDKADRDG